MLERGEKWLKRGLKWIFDNLRLDFSIKRYHAPFFCWRDSHSRTQTQTTTRLRTRFQIKAKNYDAPATKSSLLTFFTSHKNFPFFCSSLMKIADSSGIPFFSFLPSLFFISELICTFVNPLHP